MASDIRLEEVGPCKVRISFPITQDHREKAEKNVWRAFGRQARIPGFRPGKAPVHVLKRIYSEEDVRQYAENDARELALNEALKQLDLELFGDEVQVEPERAPAGDGEDESETEPPAEDAAAEDAPAEADRYTAYVSLQPRVTLGDLEKISVKRVRVTISDEDVERRLSAAAARRAVLSETDEPAAPNDLVTLTARFSKDGEDLPELSNYEPIEVRLGLNNLAFDQAITGIKAGESRTFTIPADEEWEEGLTSEDEVQVEVNAVRVRRAVPAPIDDELAKKMGAENLEALRAITREQLQAEADAVTENELTTSLISNLADLSEIEYPEEMLEQEVDELMAAEINNLTARGISLTDELERRGSHMAALRAEVRPAAELRLRRTLVLRQLARESKFSASGKERDEELQRLADLHQISIKQYRKERPEDASSTSLASSVIFRKLVEKLREKAEIIEVAGD